MKIYQKEHVSPLWFKGYEEYSFLILYRAIDHGVIDYAIENKLSYNINTSGIQVYFEKFEDAFMFKMKWE